MEIHYFRNKKKKILEKYERIDARRSLTDRIVKEQAEIAGTVDEQMKNQADAIKSLAEAEKALAEIDIMEKRDNREHARGLIGLLFGGLKAAAGAFLVWTVYGMESSNGWFQSNKESGRMASDFMREGMKDDRKY